MKLVIYTSADGESWRWFRRWAMVAVLGINSPAPREATLNPRILTVLAAMQPRLEDLMLRSGNCVAAQFDGNGNSVFNAGTGS
jgi:hypothetical protein